MNIVEFQDFSRTFAVVNAVNVLTLSLGKGEIMGFLGTNGAGKTTTIKMLIGLLKPSAGQVVLFVCGDPSDPAVRA